MRELGLPFREAHHIMRCGIALAETKQCALNDLPLVELQAIYPDIHVAFFDFFSVEKSVKSRKSFNGTAPSEIFCQLPIGKNAL